MFFKPKIDFPLFVGKCVYFAINAPTCEAIIKTRAQLFSEQSRKILHEQRLLKNVPFTMDKSNAEDLITEEERTKFNSDVLYFRLFVLNLELIKLNQNLRLGYTNEEIAACLTVALKVAYEKMGLAAEAKEKPENLYDRFKIFSTKLEKINPNELILTKLGEGHYISQIFSEVVSPDTWEHIGDERIGHKFLFINQLSLFVYHDMKNFCQALTQENKILHKS